MQFCRCTQLFNSWARIGKIVAQSSVPQCPDYLCGHFWVFDSAPTCRRLRFNGREIAHRMALLASKRFSPRMVRPIFVPPFVCLLLPLLCAIVCILFMHIWRQLICTQSGSIWLRLCPFWHRRRLPGRPTLASEDLAWIRTCLNF